VDSNDIKESKMKEGWNEDKDDPGQSKTDRERKFTRRKNMGIHRLAVPELKAWVKAADNQTSAGKLRIVDGTKNGSRFSSRFVDPKSFQERSHKPMAGVLPEKDFTSASGT